MKNSIYIFIGSSVLFILLAMGVLHLSTTDKIVSKTGTSELKQQGDDVKTFTTGFNDVDKYVLDVFIQATPLFFAFLFCLLVTLGKYIDRAKTLSQSLDNERIKSKQYRNDTEQHLKNITLLKAKIQKYKDDVFVLESIDLCPEDKRKIILNGQKEIYLKTAQSNTLGFMASEKGEVTTKQFHERFNKKDNDVNASQRIKRLKEEILRAFGDSIVTQPETETWKLAIQVNTSKAPHNPKEIPVLGH